MRYIIEKNKQEAQQQQERNMQVQGEVNAQNEQMKAQSQMALDNNLAQGKINEEIARGGIKMKQSILEANLAMLQQLKNAADAEQGINVNVNK
jgi:hypothetical protein